MRHPYTTSKREHLYQMCRGCAPRPHRSPHLYKLSWYYNRFYGRQCQAQRTSLCAMTACCAYSIASVALEMRRLRMLGICVGDVVWSPEDSATDQRAN